MNCNHDLLDNRLNMKEYNKSGSRYIGWSDQCLGNVSRLELDQGTDIGCKIIENFRTTEKNTEGFNKYGADERGRTIEAGVQNRVGSWKYARRSSGQRNNGKTILQAEEPINWIKRNRFGSEYIYE